MAFKHIRFNTEGPLAIITLNRPQYKNAQDYLMLDEVDKALTQAKDDKGVSVIKGNGVRATHLTGTCFDGLN